MKEAIQTKIVPLCNNAWFREEFSIGIEIFVGLVSHCFVRIPKRWPRLVFGEQRLLRASALFLWTLGCWNWALGSLYCHPKQSIIMGKLLKITTYVCVVWFPKYRWFNSQLFWVSNFAASIHHLWTYMDIYGGTMSKRLWYSLANCLDNRHVTFEKSTAPRIFALFRVSLTKRSSTYLTGSWELTTPPHVRGVVKL